MAAGSTVTVVRGARDVRSGEWVETSRHDIDGCGVDWTGTSELAGLQDTVTADVTVFAPYGVDVTATDQVFIDGVASRVFDVTGDPMLWRNPRSGREAGTVILLVHHRG